MREVLDLTSQPWTVSGWTPNLWRLAMASPEFFLSSHPECGPVSARVPGSVQQSLRDAGLLPDWTVEENWKLCEWVEHRHWMYETTMTVEEPAAQERYRLVCEELDYCGYVVVNRVIVGEFCGTHLRHEFDLTPHLRSGENTLCLIFTEPPSWLGQFGNTAQMTAWKPRFNYTWDWMVRLVQIGISGGISLEHTDDCAFTGIRCRTEADHVLRTGTLRVSGQAPVGTTVHCRLRYNGEILAETSASGETFHAQGLVLTDLPVALWWPNGLGEQPLYQVELELHGEDGSLHDTVTRTVGFKTIEWRPCVDAPEEADPWLCVVNGVPVFLQGVNWVPIRPNYADVTEDDYRQRITTYRDLGMNILRVWGGARLESEIFYRLCDELGLMVWQEFPMSSSGVENYPPDDPAAIEQMAEIAATYIARRSHHVSLLMWSGGNELCRREGNAYDPIPPVDASHPMIARLQEIVQRDDPTHRFVVTSASGPTQNARPEHYGKGVHWDVHGPWAMTGTMEEWRAYWEADDALLRSETGAPGASPAALIRRRAGAYPALPIDASNPLWRLPIAWWLEDQAYLSEHGGPPPSLEAYVAWSQDRQAAALTIAVRACKSRFPRCGGILLWMGHDAFPCPANTAIVDFDGHPKPAALAVGGIFQEPAAVHFGF